jgi:hypothetical protein
MCDDIEVDTRMEPNLPSVETEVQDLLAPFRHRDMGTLTYSRNILHMVVLPACGGFIHYWYPHHFMQSISKVQHLLPPPSLVLHMHTAPLFE